MSGEEAEKPRTGQPGWLPFDVDDVFAYETPKMVRIRDRRLGLAKIAVMLGIFGYVVIYEVIVNKGYLTKESPKGAVQTTLRRGDTNPTVPSYCRNTTTTSSKTPCLWLDETEALVPGGEEMSMFITTRMTLARRTLAAGCDWLVMDPAGGEALYSRRGQKCSDTAPKQHSRLNKEQGEHYYTGHIEDFTMMWAHVMYGEKTEQFYHSSDLSKAELEDYKDDELDLKARRPPGVYGDIISVKEFITFNGVDLDKPLHPKANCNHNTRDACNSVPSSACVWNGPPCTVLSATQCRAESTCNWNGTACNENPGNFCTHNTLRFEGGVFLVLIEYGTPKLKISDLGYEYKLAYIPKSGYKYIETIYRGNEVEYRNRHGLRIIFIQTGFLTKFSFQALLITLVTGTALFAVSKVVVEVIIMRLLPAKHVYENYRYLTSHDMSDVTITKDDKYGGLTPEDFVYGEKLAHENRKLRSADTAPDAV